MTEELLEEDVPRTADAVARRCVVLYAVVAAGTRQGRAGLVDWLRGEGLVGDVSPLEMAFLAGGEPTEQAMINATWRTEALGVLLWALGKVEAVDIGNVPVLRAALPGLYGATAEFVDGAALRDEVEVLTFYEAIYQAHWAVRDARLNGRPLPEGLHPGVLQERHHAFNWLIGYCGQEWDEVATDT
jgi:hypothetical protein